MAENKSPKPDKDILLAAFETARAWSSLIVTLATGAIVFTAIFHENFAPKGQLENPVLLFISWVLLGLAAILGVILLGNLIALLNKGQVEHLNLYEGVTRFLALAQWVCFIFGLGSLVWFFATNLF